MGKITTKKEPCQRLGLRKKRRLARYLSLVRPLSCLRGPRNAWRHVALQALREVLISRTTPLRLATTLEVDTESGGSYRGKLTQPNTQHTIY